MNQLFLDQSALIVNSIIPCWGFSIICFFREILLWFVLGPFMLPLKDCRQFYHFFGKGGNTTLRLIKFLMHYSRTVSPILDTHQFHPSPRQVLWGSGLWAMTVPRGLISKWPLGSIKVKLTQQHWAMRHSYSFNYFTLHFCVLKDGLNGDFLSKSLNQFLCR